MCALRYAFDASNFVSLFYKIVKVDHGVSIVLNCYTRSVGWGSICKGSMRFANIPKGKKRRSLLRYAPKILSPDVRSEKVLADEAKLYIKPSTG